MSRSYFGFVLFLLVITADSARAAIIVTPGPPADPQNYIHLSLTWSFTPPPLVTLFGGAQNNPVLVNDSLWYPRSTPDNPQLRQLSFLLEDPNVFGSESFNARLGPELDSGLPEFNLLVGEVLSSEVVGSNQFSTVRRLTFTAPGGYLRQTPEPAALAMIATAAIGLGAARRRR